MTQPLTLSLHVPKATGHTPLLKQISDVGDCLDNAMGASPAEGVVISRESFVHIREVFNEMRALLPAMVEELAVASHSKYTLDQKQTKRKNSSTSTEQPLSRIRTRMLEAECRSARHLAQSAQAKIELFAEVAAKIVGANELVENILLFVEHGTLVKSRRVSKHFCTLIDTSPTLQRRLFLKPDFSYTPHSEPRMLRRFPNGSSDATARKEFDDNENLVGRALSISVCIMIPFLRLEHRYGSIWPKMLICQPPVKKLKLPPSMCRRETREGYVMCDTGITLGHLYQVVVERLHYHQQYCGPSCRMGMKKISRRLTMTFRARNSDLYGLQQVEFCTAPKHIPSPDDFEGDR